MIKRGLNLACIYSLKKDKINALTNLSKTIELDSKYKEESKTDYVFQKSMG